MMGRPLFIVGLSAVAATCGLIVWGFVSNPIATKRALLDERLSISPPTDEAGTPQTPYAALQKAVASKPALWKPLLAPPEQQAPPPDLQAMLKEVSIGSGQIGSGDSVRVRILTGKADRRGQWVCKGDVVNGLTIKDITASEVVFSLAQGDKEFTQALPRGRR